MVKKYLLLGLTAILVIFLISTFGQSYIQTVGGLAVAQSGTLWNNLKDAAYGDNAINGIGAFNLYLYDGTNFDRARGDTTNGLDVDVTRVSGNVSVVGTKTPADNYANPTDAINSWSLLGIFDGTTWDRALESVHGDNLTTAYGLNIASFSYLFDGTNWDRARGDITNGLDVDVTRVSGNVNIVGTTTPADAFANPTNSISSYSLTGFFNGTTWDRARHSWNNISCNAVTTTGACTAIDISTSPKTKHTWTVVVTGSPTSVNVNLEGSIDNINWFTLDFSTTTTSEMRHIAGKGVMFYRGNVTTLTGGTAPTVTVRIASFND